VPLGVQPGTFGSTCSALASARCPARDPVRGSAQADDVTGVALGGSGRKRPQGYPSQPDWQLRLSTLRRTAGCRLSATPGTARPGWATVTSADRARAGQPSFRRSSLESAKITV
jgi:hypothetical protein